MTMLTVHTYLNDGEGRFWKYLPGDLLHPGPSIQVEVPTEEPQDAQPPFTPGAPASPAFIEQRALDRAWDIGNRMSRDSSSARWPSTVRSLSSGDVLVVGEVAFTIESFGFEVLEGTLEEALKNGQPSSRGSFGTPTWSEEARQAEAAQERDRLQGEREFQACLTDGTEPLDDDEEEAYNEARFQANYWAGRP